MTNNLHGPRVAPGQVQKEQTINDAIGRIDAAMSATLPLQYQNNAVIPAEDLYSHLVFALGPGAVSANWQLYLADLFELDERGDRGLIYILNQSGYTVTVDIEGFDYGPVVPNFTLQPLLYMGGQLFWED